MMSFCCQEIFTCMLKMIYSILYKTSAFCLKTSYFKNIYDYDYDYEMVLLRHTISTMYHGIIFKSCKKHNILQ